MLEIPIEITSPTYISSSRLYLLFISLHPTTSLHIKKFDKNNDLQAFATKFLKPLSYRHDLATVGEYLTRYHTEIPKSLTTKYYKKKYPISLPEFFILANKINSYKEIITPNIAVNILNSYYGYFSLTKFTMAQYIESTYFTPFLQKNLNKRKEKHIFDFTYFRHHENERSRFAYLSNLKIKKRPSKRKARSDPYVYDFRPNKLNY